MWDDDVHVRVKCKYSSMYAQSSQSRVDSVEEGTGVVCVAFLLGACLRSSHTREAFETKKLGDPNMHTHDATNF